MPREAAMNGRRVLITGAARGIGALTARRLHERGARVALLGLAPELLEDVAPACGARRGRAPGRLEDGAAAGGGAPWFECDVADRDAVDAAVGEAVQALGG